MGARPLAGTLPLCIPWPLLRRVSRALSEGKRNKKKKKLPSHKIDAVTGHRQPKAALPNASLASPLDRQIQRLGRRGAGRILGGPHAGDADAGGLADGEEVAGVVPAAAVRAEAGDDVAVHLGQGGALEGNAADEVAGRVVVGVGAVDEDGEALGVLEGRDVQGVHLVDAVGGALGGALAVALGEEVHDIGVRVDEGRAGDADPVGDVAAVAVVAGEGGLEEPLVEDGTGLGVEDADDVLLGRGDEELRPPGRGVDKRLCQP